MMVTLICVIVGVEGSAFPVDIEASESVGDLKDAIKAEKTNALKDVDADQLQLFLAKGTDDKWLKDDDPAARHISEKKTHSYIQQVISGEQAIATKTLKRWLFDSNNMSQPSAEQIHVLVVVPDQEQQLEAQNVHDSVRMREASIRESRIIMLLEQKLASLPHKTSKPYSSAAFGQLEITALAKGKRIIDFAPVEDEEAFWSEETQIQADAITNEAAFDAFITPFFSSILESCGLVFVNSQKYHWLPQSSRWTRKTHPKPDGFVTHRGMFRAKPEPNDQVHRPDGFRFGVAEEELFDCLILFESKLIISEAAFGQVARYLENFCPEESASAILFDRRSFWLIKSCKTVVYSVQIAKWVAKGSKLLFQNFISENTSPWVSYLTNACISLNVDVVEGDAFLGCGAYGRVFKVTGQGGKIFALKIVTDVESLRLEREALMKAQHTGLTISPVEELIETPESAALLLYPVGKPLPRPTTREKVRSLFELLWQLHANGLAHGDPRVPNVILTEEKALWIDLAEVMDASPVLKRRDAEILTRSILRVPINISLGSALVQSLDSYYQSATQENLDHLAEEVCQSAALLN
ncbi:unnamed protein product [Peronospora destructor]|uniref:Protein kinase domain-containing protein n=1 Tax=Peronospora destructor TaxID=86335 RepID=A0AAV0VD79_9STRA|nr:unnamed protein product [Peronospora destructor]